MEARLMSIKEIGERYGGCDWGEAAYKKVTDGETGQKVFTGNGVKVHPSKAKRFKLQSESNPDDKVNTGLTKSRRAAVAIIRAKGSDYLPIIEADAQKVVSTEPDDLEDIPELPRYTIPVEFLGTAMHGSEPWTKAREFQNTPEYKEAERARSEAIARNEARRESYLAETRKGVIPEDTVAFAYKRFRFNALDLIEYAKRNGEDPKRFYLEHASQLQAHATDAADKCGVGYVALAGYIRAHGHDELAQVIEDPGAYRDRVKAESKPKRKRGPRKAKSVQDMSTDALNAEREKRLAAYLEVVEELNKRVELPPPPPPPEPEPEVEVEVEPESTGPFNPEESPGMVNLSRAEKRAAMRDAKRRRKAQRRQTRRMLRKSA